jgi:hypothetical protein
MPVEWYRTPGHDLAAKSEFDRRYARARRPHRVQYKVIKAIRLLEAGEPGAIQWARQLLTDVTVDQDAYRHDKGRAFETLARIHRGSGQWELAVKALERAIEITGPSMSGTSGLPDLTMAEILLENDPGSLPLVTDLLNSQLLTDRLRYLSSNFVKVSSCVTDVIGPACQAVSRVLCRGHRTRRPGVRSRRPIHC